MVSVMAPSSLPSDATDSTPSPDFSSLPVMALRSKIVEKILDNRVTLIIGETGCGKSSQVPQFLLDEGMEPILCTQPRRFAVVAVARMVAKARGCEVGEEVGYHIGHSKLLSEGSKIIFKTAGVLLEEMRDKGMDALRYKVVILDEVHERSVESDLVLACVKQFLLKSHDLRVVLMSATADIARYRDYFKDLGRGERVELLAIPTSTQQTIFQRRVLYLEQVHDFLGMDSGFVSDKHSSGLDPSTEAEIKPEEYKLIHSLVLHIHESEPDLEKSILVFLPTYYSLEQQWSLLRPFSSVFKVYILHRSIDTDQAFMAMKIWKSHRKVILATNIAESSVTIPGVAFVIDICRSLQVFWDNIRKKDTAELVWVSKSQAAQRKGRTGRTCDGQIFRLVSRSFFNKLNEHEPPSILRLSLRQQVLLMYCAESKAINDPKVLLQKALDPPDPEVVDDALSLLVRTQALEKPNTRGRYEPTFYGRLLASLSLSFDASFLILKFGEVGLLREGIVIGVLMDQQPLPILHPFGQEFLFKEYLESYFGDDNIVFTGKKELMFMGNLCAYQFWQRVFKDKHRLQRLEQLLDSDEPKATHDLFPKLEEEWCSFHNLVQSPLHNVSDIYEDIINALHRYRPKFLANSNGIPSYYDPYEFEHTCFLQSQPEGGVGSNSDDEEQHEIVETTTCVALPFVASNHFQCGAVAEKLASIIKEIRIHYTEDTSASEQNIVDSLGFHVTNGVSLCRFFINGTCNKGSECYFSHSLQAKRPVCKFFFSYQGCRNGESCFFSHDLGPSAPSISSSSFCSPEDEHPDATLFLKLLPTSSDGCVLVLDDHNSHFSSNLCHYCDPSRIISTTSVPQTSIFDNYLPGVRIMWGLSHPYHTIVGECDIPWRQVQCVLWFVKFTNGEGLDKHRSLLRKFFEYLAIRIFGDSLYEVRVILTMNNLRFSQLQVQITCCIDNVLGMVHSV
ncbi:hypothetical protein AQUCO_01700172v1 [Aquilegia coerulea]|uniref:RNA helicase n=1 Tax=Aquilegia coerulea TaxID=218851 RepID=A0A2G5DLJ6_AQUCA|nr:hypothetical protein AQUCO_01700172v1 [Aquilegia coerulea]